jgi:hypothetical protein
MPSVLTERRAKPRIQCGYPALVRGRETDGREFEARATLENLSAGGAYLRQQQFVTPGQPLTVLIRLSSASPEEVRVPSIATLGTVVRSKLQADGTCGLAIKFRHHRFL